MKNELLTMPLWQMTGAEFLELNNLYRTQSEMVAEKPAQENKKKYVYGINGIANLFGCSKTTANRLKKSGVIDAAITQHQRKIVVDAELALQLAGKKVGGRRIK